MELNFIEQMPKVDLHLHLDGSVKPETLAELAEQQGQSLQVENKEELYALMKVDGTCSSLVEYLQKFDFVLPFLQTADALERVAYEIVEQSALHRCKYIEVRFAPRLHTNKGLTMQEVIESVLSGLQKGENRFGVISRGIVICLRSHRPEDNIKVIEATIPYYNKGIVAVDLAGDEASFPPERHTSAFLLAKRHNIPITIHAGEAAGASSIRGAITQLGASRIGHGIRLREDMQLLEEVRQRNIPLEMCPISNIQTQSVPGWEQYPIQEYLKLGLHITINTDNLTVSNTNITKEYRVLSDHFGFTHKEMEKLVLNGAEAAFLSVEEKLRLKQSIQDAFTQLMTP